MDLGDLLRSLWPWLVAVATPLAAYGIWSLVLGGPFNIAQDWFGRHVLDFATFWGSWSAAVIYFFDYHVQTQAYLGLEFASLTLAIVACVWALKRAPGIALYGLVVIVLAMTSAPPQSMIRYVLAIPPMFMLLARLGRNVVFDRGWILASILILGPLTTLFSFNFWVG